MDSARRFLNDSSSKTCVFGSLWFEDLRPGQATVLVLRGALMAGEVPGPEFAGFCVRAGIYKKIFRRIFLRKKFE
jgi:hypothetical protein